MERFENKKNLLQHFARLLTYPHEKPVSDCESIAPLAGDVEPLAVPLLNTFAAHVNDSTLSQLQELFTSTFDVQVVCYPYLGYQLFGESYKRGTFMVRLIEFYKHENFSVEKELPDHLAVVLKFISLTRDDDLFDHLLEECIIPSLEKMKAAFKNENPYAILLEALLTVAAALQLKQESVQID